MRSKTDKLKIESFMAALGRQVRGKGRVYLTGGAMAVLHGWRPMIIDIMKTDDLISGLPGEILVRQGLADLEAGLCTIPACLVRIARPRLSRAGLMPRSAPGHFAEPEFQLYDLLKLDGGDAHSRYNGLVRELVSFENALDRRKARIAKLE